MRFILLGAAALLTACVSVNANVTAASNPALAAIEHANVRTCPEGRAQIGAHNEGFGPQHGVTARTIAITPAAGEASRIVRLRLLTMAPGAVIAWHSHETTQGMALIVSGQATEIRNSCLDQIIYRAGDVALEDAQTAHGWRNDGDEPAVILVAHYAPAS
ncbi:MAG TPA: cupin domain-containing protein [Vitreimonas sp.]|uniref:cupin domain-containing protein n=1 Tax=Vitreimonas sp. TaxID=3069702 RepID=UPI002D6204FD|nr:cupin domain-containing protein [Vitreimonas sp.]HYD87236.1 cupin domain-containing protein [Vitreimonas sp.]